jgi:hypothetical protein
MRSTVDSSENIRARGVRVMRRAGDCPNSGANSAPPIFNGAEHWLGAILVKDSPMPSD